MKKSKVSVTKKKKGRPAIGIGTQIGMRWRDHELTAIDTWRQNQPDELSRIEAIRRLVEIGLSHSPKRGRLSHEARAKASTMAGEIVDQLTDAAAPVEEQEKRKRRLIHGPREFRDVRQDQAGAKPRPKPGGKTKRL
jgi:hypothetical protein